ncbi:hypothetical protein WICPIJ_000410 [Wickerhamomyces pijperi]|uniref:HTH TFE/IIEalpha-type domain-containing protein n=1 Tax=Wickerhamomyces pijperi TaxID=599730 RepID=A0A9P8QGQ2_WICPI|nr:hypothetical protein WICPIJ_000410 [Wickerhamomyces pijperi]
MDTPMDETVRALIRFVVRGFYGNPYVLILDAILKHSVLSEEDLSYLLGIQKKELRAVCQTLIDDRLLTVYTQKEPGPQMRPITKTYYFIHFTEAIDSIKWKVHSVVIRIKDQLSTEAGPQGYICPVCKTKYSQMDAVTLLNYEKNEFLCTLCNESLIEDDSGKIAKETQDKYERLMKQLEPVISYLRKIDEIPIAENNFETSLGKVVPAQANTTASYSVSSIGKNSKMFNKDSYLNNLSSRKAGAKSQATLHVNITANDDNLVRERQLLALEEKRKQNAMPAWHEQSTVGSSALGILNDEEEVNAEDSGKMEEAMLNVKTEGGQDSKANTPIPQSSTGFSAKSGSAHSKSTIVESEDKEAQDALAAYYAQLAAQEKEDADEDEEEDEEDEDEEMDFEDVDFEDIDLDSGSQNTATSASASASASAVSAPAAAVNDAVIVEEDFADSDEE